MKLRLSSLSLQSRMLWLIGCSVILGLAALISYVSWKSSSVVERLSIEKAELEASDIAFDIHFATADAISEVNDLARFISIDVRQGRANREIVIEELKACAERAKTALGFWACFEPNAFDGKDQEHLGKPGSNSAGLFSPYWNRAGKELVLENGEDFQKEDYYLIPQKNKAPAMLEPYWDEAGGKKVLMTSYAVPLYLDGRFLGVIGVDFELGFLTGIANQSTYIRDNAGYVTVVSADRRYAAHPKSERLGKPLFEFDPWAKSFEQQISEGKAFTTNNFSHTLKDTVFRIVSPIIIAEGTKSWTVLVNLPRGSVLAEVNHLRRNILLISGGILLLVLTVLLLLARAISNPIHNLAVRLRDASHHTSEASSHVSTSSQALAQGASSQAAAIEESSASLEELTSMARQNGDSAKEATRLANEARGTADQGMAEMEKMKLSMDAIKVSSDEIAKIIKTIDEIAFQTNILALNAAVEAARAGEAGAGFAVVAEEVRALAQRSATAARETSEKIAGAITNTGQGVQLSTVVAERLQEITTKIRSLDELVARIARATGEEAQGLVQINKAIADMDRVTQANAAGAEESASSAEDLRSQAELMHNAVEELDTIIRGQSRN